MEEYRKRQQKWDAEHRKRQKEHERKWDAKQRFESKILEKSKASMSIRTRDYNFWCDIRMVMITMDDIRTRGNQQRNSIRCGAPQQRQTIVRNTCSTGRILGGMKPDEASDDDDEVFPKTIDGLKKFTVAPADSSCWTVGAVPTSSFIHLSNSSTVRHNYDNGRDTSTSGLYF